MEVPVDSDFVLGCGFPLILFIIKDRLKSHDSALINPYAAGC